MNIMTNRVLFNSKLTEAFTFTIYPISRPEESFIIFALHLDGKIMNEFALEIKKIFNVRMIISNFDSAGLVLSNLNCNSHSHNDNDNRSKDNSNNDDLSPSFNSSSPFPSNINIVYNLKMIRTQFFYKDWPFPKDNLGSNIRTITKASKVAEGITKLTGFVFIVPEFSREQINEEFRIMFKLLCPKESLVRMGIIYSPLVKEHTIFVDHADFEFADIGSSGLNVSVGGQEFAVKNFDYVVPTLNSNLHELLSFLNVGGGRASSNGPSKL